MRDFIENYEQILPLYQKRTLQNYYTVYNDITSYENGKQAFQPYYVDGELVKNYLEALDSNKWNKSVITLTADMNALYSQANYIDSILRQSKQFTTKELETINNNIEDAYAKLDIKKFKTFKSPFKEIFYDHFRTDQLIEDETSMLYSDNYSKAQLDNKNHIVTIPAPVEFNYSNEVDGKSISDIEIIDRRGVSVGPVNTIHNIKYATDSSQDTYWSELILTDEPIKTLYQHPQNPDDRAITGAVAAVKISFRGSKIFNEIRIKPFCEWPIYILGIYAVNDDVIVSNLISNVKTGATTQDPCFIDSSKSFLFNETESSGIVIVFVQPHYKKTNFRLPKYKRENYEIFNTIFQTSEVFGMIDYSQFKTDEDLLKSSSNIVNTMVREYNTNIPWNDKAGDVMENYSKYEYTLGSYDIAVKYNAYKEAAEVISKPFKVSGNVGQVALYANACKRNEYGIIEYDLLIGDDGEKVVPILPMNENDIYEIVSRERIDNDRKYWLRFPYHMEQNKAIDVYKITHNKTYTFKAMTYFQYDTSKRGKNYIKTDDFDFDEAYYVIKYPVTILQGYDPRIVDILHEFVNIIPGSVEEKIDKFSSEYRYIKLSKVPFCDHGLLKRNNYNANSSWINGEYTPVLVNIDNCNISFYNTTTKQEENITSMTQYIDGVSLDNYPYVYNKTNYISNTMVEFEDFEAIDTSGNIKSEGDNYLIQYQQLGDRLVFNTPDLSGSTFNVRYYTLPDTVRLRIRLISSIPGSGDLPPYVDSYALMVNKAEVTSMENDISDDYGYGILGLDEGDSGVDFVIREVDYYPLKRWDRVPRSHTVIGKNANIQVPRESEQLGPYIKPFKIINTGNTACSYKVYARFTNASQEERNNAKWSAWFTGPAEFIEYTDIDITQSIFPGSEEWQILHDHTLDYIHVNSSSIQLGAKQSGEFSILTKLTPKTKTTTCEQTMWGSQSVMVEYTLMSLIKANLKTQLKIEAYVNNELKRTKYYGPYEINMNITKASYEPSLSIDNYQLYNTVPDEYIGTQEYGVSTSTLEIKNNSDKEAMFNVYIQAVKVRHWETRPDNDAQVICWDIEPQMDGQQSYTRMRFSGSPTPDQVFPVNGYMRVRAPGVSCAYFTGEPGLDAVNVIDAGVPTINKKISPSSKAKLKLNFRVTPPKLLNGSNRNLSNHRLMISRMYLNIKVESILNYGQDDETRASKTYKQAIMLEYKQQGYNE